MKLSHLFVLFLCLSYSKLALAEIYKRVDAQGHVTYSSEPIKGSKKIELKPLPTMPGSRSSRHTPEDFPRVDSQTQKNRDATRKIILEDELATEEKLLVGARENLKELESNPPPLVDAAGVPFRNTGQHAEKLKTAQDAVTLHENNIKALRTEIANLKQ
jgi:Domain of unknown function (DUF4124)